MKIIELIKRLFGKKELASDCGLSGKSFEETIKDREYTWLEIVEIMRLWLYHNCYLILPDYVNEVLVDSTVRLRNKYSMEEIMCFIHDINTKYKIDESAHEAYLEEKTYDEFGFVSEKGLYETPDKIKVESITYPMIMVPEGHECDETVKRGERIQFKIVTNPCSLRTLYYKQEHKVFLNGLMEKIFGDNIGYICPKNEVCDDLIFDLHTGENCSFMQVMCYACVPNNDDGYAEVQVTSDYTKVMN